MKKILNPEIIRAMFANGEFIQAHASALTLFVQQPQDYELGLLFLQTAIFIERADSVIEVLHDVSTPISTQIPAQSLHLLLFQAHLCAGHFALAWQHLHATGLAKDSVAFHDCAYRIDFQEHNLSAALARLEAIERQVDCSLTHFIKKFEILKMQGQYREITRQIGFLRSVIPQHEVTSHQQLQLWQAGVAHNEHNFEASLQITEQVIVDFLALAPAKQASNINTRPPSKAWTRQRQHLVIKDLERLILMHELPMFMVAGSLLSLVREGDFFLADKDIDLGLLDADFEQATQFLVNSRYFDDVSPPNYFVGYKQLRHCATGFIVDVTHYHTQNEQVHAIWGHVSGEILRQTSFAAFTLREEYFPSLRCRVLVPTQVENYLTSLYGDWRTPNRYFDTVVAACNLCKLTPFLLSLSFIRIADALLNGMHQKVKASVKHLHDCGFQSKLLTKILTQIHDIP